MMAKLAVPAQWMRPHGSRRAGPKPGDAQIAQSGDLRTFLRLAQECVDDWRKFGRVVHEVNVAAAMLV